MILRSLVISVLYFLYSLDAAGADTVFVNKHHFSAPVRNVLAVDNIIYAKTGDGLYKLAGSDWKKMPIEFTKPFVFYENGWVEEDFLPRRSMFNADAMARLIPQLSLTGATKAELANRLFVSVGGSLFEYQINRQYRLEYGERSIRNILLEPGLKMVSTYSGVFINDSVRVPEPKHSNGYFSRIGNRIYLCSDHLYEFIPPTGFKEITGGYNLFSGYSRKLVEFEGVIYSLNTKSINRYDSLRELVPVHQGYEYFDLEVVDNRLMFCTQSGEVFSYDGNSVSRVLRLKSRIRDLYVFGKTIYISSDQGVFSIQGTDSATMRQIASLPFAVMTVVDPQRNTWIATENGLFVLPDGKKDPIPFIPDVEFNRAALVLDGDDIYAGSISGIYVFNSYDVRKEFLPLYFNKKTEIESRKRRRVLFWVFGVAALISLAGMGYLKYRRRHSKMLIPQKEPSKAMTLDQIAMDIKKHGIMTVEALADHYKTNTVQLNRQFKTFGTTPGRFMKKVKLDYARELLEQKVPLEDISGQIGYSPMFIRKELQIQS